MGIIKTTLVAISEDYSDLADYIEDVLGADDDDLANIAWAEQKIKELNEKHISKLSGGIQDTAEKKKKAFEKTLMSNNVLPATVEQINKEFVEEVESEISKVNTKSFKDISVKDFTDITLRSANKPDEQRFEKFKEAEHILNNSVKEFTQEKSSGLKKRASLQDLRAEITAGNLENEGELLDIVDVRIRDTARKEGNIVTFYNARLRLAKTKREVNEVISEARKDDDLTPKRVEGLEEAAEARAEDITEEG